MYASNRSMTFPTTTVSIVQTCHKRPFRCIVWRRSKRAQVSLDPLRYNKTRHSSTTITYLNNASNMAPSTAFSSPLTRHIHAVCIAIIGADPKRQTPFNKCCSPTLSPTAITVQRWRFRSEDFHCLNVHCKDKHPSLPTHSGLLYFIQMMVSISCYNKYLQFAHAL